MTICVDSSFILKLLIEADHSATAAQLWLSWADAEPVVAPALLSYEVTSVLRTAVHRVRISECTALAALDRFFDLLIQVHQSPLINEDALRLAGKLGAGAAYDSHYIVRSKLVEGTLWTADRGMFTMAQRLGYEARLLGA